MGTLEINAGGNPVMVDYHPIQIYSGRYMLQKLGLPLA